MISRTLNFLGVSFFGVAQILIVLMSIVLVLSLPGDARAVDFSAIAGIDGHGRAGMWSECRTHLTDPGAAKQMLVSTVDGDGVGVRYASPVDGQQAARCYFQMGRGTQRLKVMIEDQAGKTVASTSTESPVVIPFEQPWILAIGDAIGIQGSSDQQGRRNLPVVSTIIDGQQLPHHWIAYNGVDLIVLPGSHASIVNDLQVSQKQALADWVRHGGRLVMTLGGQSLPAVQPNSWINEYLGIGIEQEVVDIDPRSVESYTATQEPLKPFAGLRLPAEGGRTLLTGRTLGRQTVPIAKEYLLGFGRVLVIAADLDQEPFASWIDRNDLLDRFIPNVLTSRSSSTQKHSRDTGYTDLVGQIRRTIDQFDSHWVVPFKWIAGFFVIYLSLIGPVDHWLVNRILGRPLLGWLTFPAMVMAFAAFAFYGSKVATPSQPVVNQFAIIDIAPGDRVGRGFAWSQYLSATAARSDLAYKVRDEFAGSGSDMPLMGWWGIAGEEFGGLVSTGRDHQMPEYSINQQHNQMGHLASAASELPLATAATKGLAARWMFQPDLAITSELRQRTGTDLLSGRVSNPLGVDLMDAVLIYRGWVYLLPTRFSAGKEVADVSLTTSKNLKWRLTRRSVDSGSRATEPWNPEMSGDLDRMLEIAMFYDTAGGSNYTELGNRIINDLDLSHVLATDHAILLGRVDQSLLDLHADQKSTVHGMLRSYVRVLLPVATGR